MVHHWRERLTGPGFPLLVVQCREHRHAFTIYPPGFAPYAREPVVRAAPDGSLPPETTGLQPRLWQGTLFDAARDAAAGEAWRPQGAAFTTGRWRTQQRHIEHAACLLALTQDTRQQQRHQVANHLGLSYLDLQDAARHAARVPGYRQRGSAVHQVLSRLRLRPSLPADLLRCGAVAGIWAEPVFA